MAEIFARYWIETPHPVEKAVEAMAGEQSSGTFISVPGETNELKEKHAARVDQIEITGESSSPSLPGAKIPSGVKTPVYRQARVTIRWPFDNVGANLSNLMATVAGNLFELNQFSGLRLLDVDVPDEFHKNYSGPKFGIEGTRRLMGIEGRPIIGTIIKPSVGLSPDQTALQVKELVEGGLDFLKDDELMGDSPHSPFEKRVDAVMKVINNHADKTGRRAMFAFNISGDIEDMMRRHDYVVKNGGNCVMVSLNWIGISGLIRIAKHSTITVHGHRNGWGLMSRSPYIGIDFLALQKIWRLAGADHLHTNGLRNKFSEPDHSVITSIKACQTSFGGKKVMPVISSGQWAGQAVDTYKAIGNADMMYVCGGGIVAHPSGIKAGVMSIQQAWEAAMKGESLESYGQQHIELKQALDFFSKRL